MSDPHQYKLPSRRRRVVHRRVKIDRISDDPEITGWVNGVEARVGEEYLAKAWRYLGITFNFQVPIYVATSLPGRPKEVDFIVNKGGRKIALEVDGPWHETFGEEALDTLRDHLLAEVLLLMGIFPIIKHVDENELWSFESALTVARSI